MKALMAEVFWQEPGGANAGHGDPLPLEDALSVAKTLLLKNEGFVVYVMLSTIEIEEFDDGATE